MVFKLGNWCILQQTFNVNMSWQNKGLNITIFFRWTWPYPVNAVRKQFNIPEKPWFQELVISRKTWYLLVFYLDWRDPVLKISLYSMKILFYSMLCFFSVKPCKYSGISIKQRRLVQKNCDLFLEIFSKIVWPQSKAVRFSSYCPPYRGVRFIVSPIYKDSTVE